MNIKKTFKNKFNDRVSFQGPRAKRPGLFSLKENGNLKNYFCKK
jgi:hypothetical protein